MAIEPHPLAEAILKQLSGDRLCVGQSRDAIAKIPWWEESEFAAQPTGASPIIRDGHNRGQVGGVLL